MALIIAGHPRSGTTLLARLCDQHPDIRVTKEFREFRSINVGYAEHVRSLRKNWYRHQIVGRRTLRNRLASGVFLAEYLLRLLPLARGQIGVKEVEGVLHSMFPQARIVGDKYPRYVFQLDNLVQESGLQIVVIYRDCRDVTSSTLRMTRTIWRNRSWIQNIDSAPKVSARWVSAIEMMQKHRSIAYCIRYESLVQNPGKELNALANWLGVDPGGFSTELVHTSSVGKHRMGLSPQEVDQVLEIAGPTMKTLGFL